MLNAAGFSCVLGVAGDGGPVLVLWACAVAIGILLVLAIWWMAEASTQRERAAKFEAYGKLADSRLAVLARVARGELPAVGAEWFGAEIADHGYRSFWEFANRLRRNQAESKEWVRFASQLKEILKDYESRILGAPGEELAARKIRLEEWVKLRNAEIRKEGDEGNEYYEGVALGERSGIVSGSHAATRILLDGYLLKPGEAGVELVPPVTPPEVKEEIAPETDGFMKDAARLEGNPCLMLGILGVAGDGSAEWILAVLAVAWMVSAVLLSMAAANWKRRALKAEEETMLAGKDAVERGDWLDGISRLVHGQSGAYAKLSSCVGEGECIPGTPGSAVAHAAQRIETLLETERKLVPLVAKMRPAWEFLGITEHSNIEKSLAEMRRFGEAIYAATSGTRPDGEVSAGALTFYGLMSYGSQGAALLRQAETLRQERDKRTGGMPESEIKIRSERLFAWVALRRGETRLGSGRREDFAEGKAIGEREGLSEAASAAVRILLDGATVDANGGIVPPADYKTMEAPVRDGSEVIIGRFDGSREPKPPGQACMMLGLLGVLGDTVVFPDASSMVAWGCGAFAAILLFLLWLSQRATERQADRAAFAETRIVTLKKMIRGELAPTIPWPQESIVGEDFREAVKSLKLVLYTCSGVEKERDHFRDKSEHQRSVLEFLAMAAGDPCWTDKEKHRVVEEPPGCTTSFPPMAEDMVAELKQKAGDHWTSTADLAIREFRALWREKDHLAAQARVHEGTLAALHAVMGLIGKVLDPDSNCRETYTIAMPNEGVQPIQPPVAEREYKKLLEKHSTFMTTGMGPFVTQARNMRRAWEERDHEASRLANLIRYMIERIDGGPMVHADDSLVSIAASGSPELNLFGRIKALLEQGQEFARVWPKTSSALSTYESYVKVAMDMLAGIQPIPAIDVLESLPEPMQELLRWVERTHEKSTQADANAAVANRLRHEQTRISRFALEGTGAARDEDSYETKKAFDWIAEQKSYRAAVDQLAPVIVSIAKKAGVSVREGENIHLELLQNIDRWLEKEISFRDEAHQILLESLEGKCPGVESAEPMQAMFAKTVDSINQLWRTIRSREEEVRDCNETIRAQTAEIQERQRRFDEDMAHKVAEIETAGRLIHGMLDGQDVSQQASFPWVWGVKNKIEALFARVRQLEDVVDLPVPTEDPLNNDPSDAARTRKLKRDVAKVQVGVGRWYEDNEGALWICVEYTSGASSSGFICKKDGTSQTARFTGGGIRIDGQWCEFVEELTNPPLSIPVPGNQPLDLKRKPGHGLLDEKTDRDRMDELELQANGTEKLLRNALTGAIDKTQYPCFRWAPAVVEMVWRLREQIKIDGKVSATVQAAVIEGEVGIAGNEAARAYLARILSIPDSKSNWDVICTTAGKMINLATGAVKRVNDDHLAGLKASREAIEAAVRGEDKPSTECFEWVQPLCERIRQLRKPARLTEDEVDARLRSMPAAALIPEGVLAYAERWRERIEGGEAVPGNHGKPWPVPPLRKLLVFEEIEGRTTVETGEFYSTASGTVRVKLSHGAMDVAHGMKVYRKVDPMGGIVDFITPRSGLTRAELLGAIGRGWCSKENEHKVMDPDLAQAIAAEVERYLVIDTVDMLADQVSTFCEEASQVLDADSVMKLPAILETLKGVVARKDVLEQQAVILRGSISPVPPEDIEQNWSTFWKEILLKDGELDWDQLKKELSDFSRLMHSASVVFDYVSGNVVSKCNTDPEVVKRLFDDHVTQLVEEQTKDLQEALEAYQAEDRAAAEQNSTEEAAALEQLSYVGTPGDGAPETLQLLKVPVADLQRVPDPVEGLVPMGDRVNAEMLAKIEQLENADVGKLVKRVESLERIEKDMIDGILRGHVGIPVVKSMQEQGEDVMRAGPASMSREIAYMEDGTFFEIERFEPKPGDQYPAVFLQRNHRSASNRWDLIEPAGDAGQFTNDAAHFEHAKPIGVRQKANEVKAPDPMEHIRPGRQAWHMDKEVRFLQVVGEHAWIEWENGSTDLVEPHYLKFKKPE